MQLQRLPLNDVRGHILPHNIVNDDGRRLVRKGVCLTDAHVARLRAHGLTEIEVVVLAATDVREDDAAAQIVEHLLTPELSVRWSIGGRANLLTTTTGLFSVDVGRLHLLNTSPGITLATLPQFSVVSPTRGQDQVATLKIIPYAIPEDILTAACARLKEDAPLLRIQPLPEQQIALLIVGNPAVHEQLQSQFESPIRQRLERLGSTLAAVVAVPQDAHAVAAAAQRLLEAHDMLIVAGQTSVMDEDDLVLRGLRMAGADVSVHGAPVEPGNLLALAYVATAQNGTEVRHKPIMCAPGCARSMAHNVVDMVLPRLLGGAYLTQDDVAELGLGGLLR